MFGPVAPQLEAPELAAIGTSIGETSEDCLYLNIWTPATDDARRPVMVWIHGGAFIIGSGSQTWYDGTALSRRGDVVVVTINYRLGALGFLHLPDLVDGDLASSGNAGLLDQVAALRWVHDNISSFGGDPDNVTIFGESAGAMSVCTLCGSPVARGLFHKAIAQSGGASAVRPSEQATGIARGFLSELGIGETPSVSELLDVPVEQVMAAQERCILATGSSVGSDAKGQLMFEPVVDGEVLPSPPLDSIRHGLSAEVPLLIGTNLDEMKLFSLLDPAYQINDEAQLLSRFVGIVGQESVARKLIEAFDDDGHSPSDLWSAISTDWVFRNPALRMMEAHIAGSGAAGSGKGAGAAAGAGTQDGAGVWSYLFTWPSSILDGALGSCHALEIPFVWGTLDDPLSALFLGDATGADDLAARMQDAWLAFARTGDPNTTGLPQWPQYDTDHRPTLIMGKDRKVEHDPLRSRRQAWELIEG